jgi:GR25 family glycosyltransferase involved in LPS biosynthesis
MKGQVGCYLSHYNIYKKIRQDNRLGYTIVFEDDFVIKDENLLNKIKKIIENTNKKEIDFDLLFLGNLKDNHGTQIVDNLYYVDKSNNLYGTHAYVVNNKNINKIISKTENIDRPIDNKLEDCAKNETLNIEIPYFLIVYLIYAYNISRLFKLTFKNKITKIIIRPLIMMA